MPELTEPLLTEPPEFWARTAKREELHRAARAVQHWTNEIAEVLDHAYLERSLRLLGREREHEEAIKLADDLQRVAHDRNRAALDALDRPYFARWRLLGELLQASARRAEVPTGVLARKHVLTILQELCAARGRLAQSKLDRVIKNPGQLSATLALMEDWDLVEREKHGSANTVVLTELGRLAIAQELTAADAADAPREERHINLMSVPMSAA